MWEQCASWWHSQESVGMPCPLICCLKFKKNPKTHGFSMLTEVSASLSCNMSLIDVKDQILLLMTPALHFHNGFVYTIKQHSETVQARSISPEGSHVNFCVALGMHQKLSVQACLLVHAQRPVKGGYVTSSWDVMYEESACCTSLPNMVLWCRPGSRTCMCSYGFSGWSYIFEVSDGCSLSTIHLNSGDTQNCYLDLALDLDPRDMIVLCYCLSRCEVKYSHFKFPVFLITTCCTSIHLIFNR